MNRIILKMKKGADIINIWSPVWKDLDLYGKMKAELWLMREKQRHNELGARSISVNEIKTLFYE